MSIWSRLAAAFGSTAVSAPPNDEREDDGEYVGGGLFSTHFEGMGPPKRAAVAGALTTMLRAHAPRAIAAGEGADGLDLTSGGLGDIPVPNVADVLFAWFGTQTFIGHQICAILAQHWLIDKICTMPARDAIRHGFDIVIPGKDEETTAKITDMVNDASVAFRLNHHLLDYLRKGRIFGIRLALFKVRSTDPKYYEYPFNPDAVTPGSYEGIVQIDPYWVSPVLDQMGLNNPTDQGFYEPTWWTIQGKLYHKSHFRIFRTAEVADLLKPQYQYGGVPIPQKIMERVYAAERTANEAPQLAMTKRLTVWNTDVGHILANQDAFAVHMNNFINLRDNYSMKINDTEDKMEQFDTTLNHLGEIIEGQYAIACAAGDAPITKVMGTSPKGGLGSKGDFEVANYHEFLEGYQDHDATPFLDMHFMLLARSVIEPAMSMAPGSLVIRHEWLPLDSPTAKEVAETNLVKAQTDAQLTAAGAIDGEDVRNRIRTEADSGYTGISPDVPEPPEEEPADAEAA